VESGRPMTLEERLEIFSGPKGKHRNLLEGFAKFVAAKKA